MTLQTLLESTMLACFGLAWPVANLRMLRTRRPEGKGLAFTLIILTGYVAGALAKCPAVSGAAALPAIFWLYALNGASVALNLLLQWHYGRVGPGPSLRQRLRGAVGRLMVLVAAALALAGCGGGGETAAEGERATLPPPPSVFNRASVLAEDAGHAMPSMDAPVPAALPQARAALHDQGLPPVWLLAR